MSTGGLPNCQGCNEPAGGAVLPQVSAISPWSELREAALSGAGLLPISWGPSNDSAVGGVLCSRSGGNANNDAATGMAVVSGVRGPFPALSPAIGVFEAIAAAARSGSPGCRPWLWVGRSAAGGSEDCACVTSTAGADPEG